MPVTVEHPFKIYIFPIHKSYTYLWCVLYSYCIQFIIFLSDHFAKRQISFNKISHIMIRNLRLVFPISHLSYSPQTIPLLQKFHHPTSTAAFSLLNFQHPAPSQPLLSRLFKPKPHAELLQLYIKFIEIGEDKASSIAYQSIEKNLRTAVIKELKQKRIKISVDTFKVMQSELIEETEFRGVFIHRNLNLNSSAYEIKPHNNKRVSFELKKTLRSDAMQEYERIIRTYNIEKMDKIYCQSYDQFQRDKEIRRSIYRVTAEIAMTMDQEGKKQKIGGNGTTQHLIQVESVFNRYYNMEEFFLTDVDFVLKGNYFLRNKLS